MKITRKLLKATRLAMGLTPTQFARKIMLSPEHYRAIEAGKKEVPLTMNYGTGHYRLLIYALNQRMKACKKIKKQLTPTP